jgi:mannose-6-phosphate isomerase-like protein (cupin superfamily)
VAHTGQKLTNPFTGQSIVFRRTTEETAGELVEVESIYSTAGSAAPAHFHPSQDEHFEVLEGELTAVLDGEERELGPGDTLEIPAGTPHVFRKAEGVEARMIWVTRPALRTEEFFELVFGGDLEGRDLLREFEAEFRLAEPAVGS